MVSRFRSAATLVALIAILLTATYYGWEGLTRGWLDGSESRAAKKPTESCSTPPAVTTQAEKVRVSVYNAGAPGGEATEVMQALLRQGFVRGELGDAPPNIDINGLSIRPGKADRGDVRLVKRQFTEVRVIRQLKPFGPGINVLVGNSFTSLARHAPRTLDLQPKPICGPLS
ncbi:MAG: LytR C-terminal domain-containing protein [Nocardioidaceae bacterium]